MLLLKEFYRFFSSLFLIPNHHPVGLQQTSLNCPQFGNVQLAKKHVGLQLWRAHRWVERQNKVFCQEANVQASCPLQNVNNYREELAGPQGSLLGFMGLLSKMQCMLGRQWSGMLSSAEILPSQLMRGRSHEIRGPGLSHAQHLFA